MLQVDTGSLIPQEVQQGRQTTALLLEQGNVCLLRSQELELFTLLQSALDEESSRGDRSNDRGSDTQVDHCQRQTHDGNTGLPPTRVGTQFSVLIA